MVSLPWPSTFWVVSPTVSYEPLLRRSVCSSAFCNPRLPLLPSAGTKMVLGVKQLALGCILNPPTALYAMLVSNVKCCYSFVHRGT